MRTWRRRCHIGRSWYVGDALIKVHARKRKRKGSNAEQSDARAPVRNMATRDGVLRSLDRVADVSSMVATQSRRCVQFTPITDVEERMCGRFAQALPAELLVRMFGAVDLRQEIARPSWNMAPATSVTAAAWDARRHRRVLVPMIWGLLAPWEKHWDTARLRPINARCETIAASRLFAPAFRQRRCLIAVDGWYEWARQGGQKSARLRPRRPDARGAGRDLGVLEKPDRRSDADPGDRHDAGLG